MTWAVFRNALLRLSKDRCEHEFANLLKRCFDSATLATRAVFVRAVPGFFDCSKSLSGSVTTRGLRSCSLAYVDAKNRYLWPLAAAQFRYCCQIFVRFARICNTNVLNLAQVFSGSIWYDLLDLVFLNFYSTFGRKWRWGFLVESVGAGRYDE